MRTFILRMLYILVLDATNLLDLFISLIFNLQAEFIFHVHFTEVFIEDLFRFVHRHMGDCGQDIREEEVALCVLLLRFSFVLKNNNWKLHVVDNFVGVIVFER